MNKNLVIGIIENEVFFLDLYQNNFRFEDGQNTIYSSKIESAIEWIKHSHIDILLVSDSLVFEQEINFSKLLLEIKESAKDIKLILYSIFGHYLTIYDERTEKKFHIHFHYRDIFKLLTKIIDKFEFNPHGGTFIEDKIDRPNKELLIKDIKLVNYEWSKILKEDPENIYRLSSRQFEEFIAEIWEKRGYEIQLTSRSRDGGKDIYAYKKSPDREILLAIECKKYSPLNKVGRPIVQQLNGIIESERLTGGVIATSSYFSKDAIKYAEPLKYRIFLNDILILKEILNTEI